VKVGCSLPQLGLQANRTNLVRVAQRAEELVYDSVRVLQRLLWPIEPKLRKLAADAGRPSIDVVLRGIGYVKDKSPGPNRPDQIERQRSAHWQRSAKTLAG